MKRQFLFLISLCMLLNLFGQEYNKQGPIALTEEIKWDSVTLIKMAPVDNELEKKINSNSKPPIFAKSFPVEINLKKIGYKFLTSKGRVYLVGINSPNAKSLNVIFSKFNLQEGSVVNLFSREGKHIIGGFDKRFNPKDFGSLGTMPVEGDMIYIELFEPFEVNSICTIGKISHDFLGFYKNDPNGPSGECNIDVLCAQGSPWHKEKASVALIIRGGNAWCSGALINNTGEDGRELFLTAHHCYNFETIEDNINEAANSVFVFNKESPWCNGPNGPTTMTVSGSTLKSNWSTTDFELLELNSRVPTSYYPYYSGWDRDITVAINTVGIHHPRGDDKKISLDHQSPDIKNFSNNNCSGVTGTNFWKIIDWDEGTTEKGSSGSPLFNQNHRIIGELTGGCAACGNNLSDFYGRLPVSWFGGGSSINRLSDWLDPLNLSPSQYFGLRYIRFYTVNHDAWFTGDVVKFHDVDILSGFNVVVTELQERFEATGTLDIPSGATFQVNRP